MKIKRIIDGVEHEFELTSTEIVDAHKEFEEQCRTEDIDGRLRSHLAKIISDKHFTEVDSEDVYICETAKDEMDKFTSKLCPIVEHSLSHNDSYYEAYWLTIQYNIDEHFVDEDEPTIEISSLFHIIERNKIDIFYKDTVLNNNIKILSYDTKDKYYDIYQYNVFRNEDNQKLIMKKLIEGIQKWVNDLY